MLYRVALQGFAETERRSLAAFLHEASQRHPGYELVGLSADADLILADGDSPEVIADIADQARLSTTLFISDDRPPNAAWHLPRPTTPAQLFRRLGEVVAGLEAASQDATAEPARHSEAKAAARRAARRARLAAAAGQAASIPPDVLVLDEDDEARNELCSLLEKFGFCTYPARNGAQALWLIGARTFRIAFLDIMLDGSDGGGGLEVCEQFRTRLSDAPATASGLFLMSSNPKPVDRVRAALAGGSAFLVKPLRRGDVAKVIEACGIAMPHDHRGQ
jgi:CheY-like chemotaxis protein